MVKTQTEAGWGLTEVVWEAMPLRSWHLKTGPE